MVYECDQCGRALPASVIACPVCGEKFEDAVPADAEVPKKGFSAVTAPADPSVHGGGYDWLEAPKDVSPAKRGGVKTDDTQLGGNGSSGLRVLGCLFLLGGLALAGYYFLVFDVSVAEPATTILGQTIGGGRINNLGLMSDRQNGIIIGMSGAILGAILMYAGRRK